MKTAKTDNHNPAAKLALRRHFLKRYHSDGEPVHVFDCCQGSGKIWTALRAEFEVASYWGVDVKPKAGRIKIDSVRILDQPGLSANVIDVDTYGSPWKHWFALLRNCDHSVTVFLTIGEIKINGFSSRPPSEVIAEMGLPANAPVNLLGKAAISFRSLDYMMFASARFGFELLEVCESVQSSGSARYIGVRITKRAQNSSEISIA